MTNDPLGSPVTHGENPQDRTGSQTTNDKIGENYGY